MSDAAIVTSRAGPYAWQFDDWQRLWMSIRTSKKRWRSLAILPAGPGFSPDDTLEVAVALARVGMEHIGGPVHVADATRITLAQVESFIGILGSHVDEGETLLIALSSLSDNVTSLSLAKSADAVMLCILLGKMLDMDAKKTISQVGLHHFVGSAVFKASATDR